MRRHPATSRSLAVLAALVAAAAALGLSTGSSELGPLDAVAVLWRSLWGAETDSFARVIIVDVRLPRVLLGLAVGAALAVSGSVLQAVFRNPLAEPTLVGVSSGAALGAAIAIVSGLGQLMPAALRASFLPLCAAAGGAVTTLFIQQIARRGGETVTATLLLAGLAITAFVNALLGLAMHFADDSQLRNLTFWMLGSLGGSTSLQVWVALPFMVLPIFVVTRKARQLDALLLGEVEAAHLGIEVERLKRSSVAWAALMVGAAVAMSGVIGFVGLIVPHLVRLLVGPSHAALLPRAALGGALLLLLADVVARTAVAPTELPIGALTAMLGAPFFLWLLLNGRRA